MRGNEGRRAKVGIEELRLEEVEEWTDGSRSKERGGGDTEAGNIPRRNGNNSRRGISWSDASLGG